MTSLVVGWLVVTRMHCGQTMHPRPIVTMDRTLIGNPTLGIQWYKFRPPGVTPNRGICQITLTSCIVSLMQFELRRAAAFVPSPIHLLHFFFLCNSVGVILSSLIFAEVRHHTEATKLLALQSYE